MVKCNITLQDLVAALRQAIKELKQEGEHQSSIVKQNSQYYFTDYPDPKKRPHFHWNSKYLGIDSTHFTESGFFIGQKKLRDLMQGNNLKNSGERGQLLIKILERVLKLLRKEHNCRQQCCFIKKDKDDDEEQKKQLLKKWVIYPQNRPTIPKKDTLPIREELRKQLKTIKNIKYCNECIKELNSKNERETKK